MTVMSGRWVPPANGSLRIHGLPRSGPRRAPRRRSRHRAEVDRDVLGLHDHLASRVEQAGRAVATLLDVRRVRAAHERGAHLLAGRAQRAGDDLEVDRVKRHAASSSPSTIVPASSTRPASPAPRPASPRAARRSPAHQRLARRRLAADDLGVVLGGRRRSTVRRERRRRLPAPAARSSCGPRDARRRADRDDLDRRLAVAVAVALVVQRLERLADGGERRVGQVAHGQLVRLAAVADLVGDLGLDLGARRRPPAWRAPRPRARRARRPARRR